MRLKEKNKRATIRPKDSVNPELRWGEFFAGFVPTKTHLVTTLISPHLHPQKSAWFLTSKFARNSSKIRPKFNKNSPYGRGFGFFTKNALAIAYNSDFSWFTNISHPWNFTWYPLELSGILPECTVSMVCFPSKTPIDARTIDNGVNYDNWVRYDNYERLLIWVTWVMYLVFLPNVPFPWYALFGKNAHTRAYNR